VAGEGGDDVRILNFLIEVADEGLAGHMAGGDATDGLLASFPVSGSIMVTIRSMPTMRSTCQMCSLYCWLGMKGKRRPYGSLLYLRRIPLQLH